MTNPASQDQLIGLLQLCRNLLHDGSARHHDTTIRIVVLEPNPTTALIASLDTAINRKETKPSIRNVQTKHPVYTADLTTSIGGIGPLHSLKEEPCQHLEG